MNEQIESIAEAIYDAHIALAIEQRRPSRFIVEVPMIASMGSHAYESMPYAGLPMAVRAVFFELATMTLAGWEKRV